MSWNDEMRRQQHVVGAIQRAKVFNVPAETGKHRDEKQELCGNAPRLVLRVIVGSRAQLFAQQHVELPHRVQI